MVKLTIDLEQRTLKVEPRMQKPRGNVDLYKPKPFSNQEYQRGSSARVNLYKRGKTTLWVLL